MKLDNNIRTPLTRNFLPRHADTKPKEAMRLPKDSQIDNKKKSLEKCNGQTPIGRENQNHNRNAKKHSIKNGDV